MIKDKPLPDAFLRFGGQLLSWFISRKFKKIVLDGIEIKPNNSYLLMCNHFSFWDGLLACFIVVNAIDKKQRLKAMKIMVLEKQMQMNKWLKYIGCFSIAPKSIKAKESLDYAVDVLNEPGNVLIIFPQGNLESMFIRYIKFKDGINSIIPKVKSNCQLIWSSNFIEFFEGLKPRVYFNLMDAGTNHDFDFEQFKKEVNLHHLASMKKNFRFTEEP
ncbi:1-acyl-sn-glycerol-3-phosphate acyltransferase [Pedobacter aquatilis]|uniref:1-acyl-sn-glycerol-3-phosphate acyltransferase n=1 Tax=Pedobacter aquatilis TaxID=351343 RepID=UPI0025B2F669|nr:1-acyl-sn-glycerol-3-phosphate acyltransferase [Pedobacter aquatilis]MDN3588946.1 1-acyl-sn-glycerol-3-phosphate acyltransferase [Pedobacter aquatilis]